MAQSSSYYGPGASAAGSQPGPSSRGVSPVPPSSAAAAASGPQARRTAKRQPRRTLGVLCQAMVGLTVVIELKNDSEVTGLVFESDQDMNMTLSSSSPSGVRYVNPRGVVTTHDELFVAGRMIRYIHVPENVDIDEMLTTHLRVLDRAKNEYKRQNLTKGAPSRPPAS